mgnify:CR=1 FL=1
MKWYAAISTDGCNSTTKKVPCAAGGQLEEGGLGHVGTLVLVLAPMRRRVGCCCAKLPLQRSRCRVGAVPAAMPITSLCSCTACLLPAARTMTYLCNCTSVPTYSQTACSSVFQAASFSLRAGLCSERNLTPFVSGFSGGRVKQHPIANPNRHGGEAFGVRTTWGWVQ